ncbi:potassium channel protein [filamentous cyanobacterium CCP2]|nr:potassium channel protein [filamentous cyanobacterium CCP2]
MSPKFPRNYRRIRIELTIGVVIFIGITFIGTLGYRFIEGYSWVNAAYMTIITLSTVGFTEVEPLSPRGRIFTIALIVMGIASFGYIINRFTEVLIQGQLQEGFRKRQQRRLISKLSEHYIICGFGRMGRQIASEFATENVPFLVIEFQPDMAETSQQMGYLTLQGDATLDETLLTAGIDRAVCLVSALPSDAENLYTVLSAKTLNPKVRAIARANTEEALKKLQRGGADAVVSPYITGGRRMAAAALRPQVMDFVDGIMAGTDRSLYMEEFLIDPESCPHVGQTLYQAGIRSQSGVLVLAIRRADGSLIGSPTAETVLHQMDVLICMGTAEQLRGLNQLLSPLNPRRLRLPRQASPTDQV